MKKLIAVILALSMLLSLLYGCGKTPESSAEKAGSEAAIPELETASKLGAAAIKGYVYARMLTDELLAADIETADKAWLKELLNETAAAWDAVAATTDKMAEITDSVQIAESENSFGTLFANVSLGNTLSSFAVVAYADEDEMTKWAKRVNEMYSMTDKNLKTRDRFKQLAGELGTDARGAAEQLKTANEILSSEYTADGDYFRAWENFAMATKTTCKVGLFVGGIIASGGTIGATGITLMGGETALGTAAVVGGFITGGADCIVDIANTGSNVFLGDQHVVSKAIQGLADDVAPISTFFNIANLGGATAGEALSLVGENLVSLCQDGKVGGITLPLKSKSYLPDQENPPEPEYYIDVTGMSEAEAVAAVAAAGGPQLPAENSIGIYDWLNYMDMTAADITAWTEEILSVIDEIPLPEAEAEEPADEGGALSLKKVCGSYQLKDADTIFSVYEEGGGIIVEYIYNPDAGPMSYDESSGTAFLNDGGDELTCIFSESGGTIRVDGDCRFYGSDGNMIMSMTFVGTKID